MLAQRAESHKLWDGIPAGGGPSPGDGGAGQGEEMSERPANGAPVFPAVMTEVKERGEGRARAKDAPCPGSVDGGDSSAECSPWMSSDTSTAHSTVGLQIH